MNPKRQGLAGVIRRRPITAFAVWFFTVGQAFAFAPLYLDVTIPDQWFINASTVVGLLVPTLVITWIVDGREGLRALGRCVTKVRGPLSTYAVGLVVMPLCAVGLAMAIIGTPDVPASTLVTAIGPSLLLSTVIGFAVNNLWEEVAWMGFVQARLQSRYSPLRAAVFTAPLFALQHVALVIGNGAAIGAVIMVAFAVVAIPYRAFNGWLYNRTGGSLFLVGLVHALGNAVAPGAGFGPGYLRVLYPTDADLVGVLHILAFAVIGLVTIGVTQGRLGVPRAPEDPPAAGELRPRAGGRLLR